MAIEDVFNFVKIDERIVTGGQPTKEQFADFAAAGFKGVINLAPHDAENNALPGEPDLLNALDLDYVHIPMPGDDPKPEHYEEFCAAMGKFSGQKVLVHCAANYRVSALVSSWAISNLGWSDEQADALVTSIWESNPEFGLNETWQAYISTIRQV